MAPGTGSGKGESGAFQSLIQSLHRDHQDAPPPPPKPPKVHENQRLSASEEHNLLAKKPKQIHRIASVLNDHQVHVRPVGPARPFTAVQASESLKRSQNFAWKPQK